MSTDTFSNKSHFIKLLKSPLLWGVLGCLVVAVGVWNYWGYQNKEQREPYLVLEAIPLVVKEGVKIAFVEVETEMNPTPHQIRVYTKKDNFRLKSLKQLEGLVTINHPDAALYLVRLPSKFCYEMPSPSDSEVIEIEIQKTDTPTKEKPYEPDAIPSKEFQAGGFSPANVKEKDGEYVITRWVFINHLITQKKVQYVRETVGKNGSYRREVLQEKSPPNLPDVGWYVFGLR